MTVLQTNRMNFLLSQKTSVANEHPMTGGRSLDAAGGTGVVIFFKETTDATVVV